MAILTKPKLLFLFFFILSLFLASQCDDDQNPRGQEPRRELESCLRQCKSQGESPEQQLQCQRSCVMRYEGQHQGEIKSEEVIEDILNHHHRDDPEKRLRECQQSCERQRGGQQKQLCKQRCEQEYRREQEHQRGRPEIGEDNQGRRDPEERLRECRQSCQRREEGQQQMQCQQRCQQEYQREKEQHRGQGETRDENQGRGRRDPEERLRECQQSCQRREQGQQQRQCQQRCQQEYQREKEQRRGQGETRDENQGRGRRDPEERLRECQQTCQRREQGPQQRQCQQRCQQEYQREKEQRRGQGELGDENQGREPEERLRECQQSCQREEQGPQQRQCQQRCQQEYQREKEQRHRGQKIGEEETNPEREREEENNPYLFKSQRFMSGYKSSHGDFRILEKFTQRSELLQGIEKFRVGVIEFEPQSFMMPHHCDGEAIFFVGQGQGIISIANQDEKNSFNLEKGDVLKVCAGSTIYLTNRDNNEKFRVYVLAKSTNAPGELQEYFSGGGQNPESFYRAFSSDILETAFNTQRDRLERLFGQQKQGVIIKASEEQIRAISEHASRSTEQTKGETRGPLNLLREQPLFGSRFGQFFEASPERFEQFRDLDTAVGFMNINQGGMVLPYYNTRSTRLVMVVEGNGRFEMACPHLGGQRHGQGPRGGGRRGQEEEQEQEGNVHYQKVRGTLNVGDLVVVPAGHPITFIATGNSNLRMVGFGVHAHNNKKNFLAGKQSIWRNVDREAKELSFNMPGREVEEIFQKQDQSFFVEGPEQHRQRGGGRRGQEQHTLSSILDFVF